MRRNWEGKDKLARKAFEEGRAGRRKGKGQGNQREGRGEGKECVNSITKTTSIYNTCLA